MKSLKSYGLKSLLIAFIVISIALAIYVGRRSRLVWYEKTADGTEIAIYQSARPGELCFDTSFVYRVAGGKWKYHYYDHEDASAWKGCKTDVDEERKSIVIYRNGRPDIRFNWGSDVFERHQGDGFVVDSSLSHNFGNVGRDLRDEVLGAIERTNQSKKGTF